MRAYRNMITVALVVGLVSGRRLPPVYWNSSNSIFDISNTDHVMQVEIGDQVSIICPEPGVDYEFTQLYMVSEEEYQHCALLDDRSKLIGACQDATQSSMLSIVFRKFSPQPGGLEFAPGHTYYVISTSDGTQDGLTSRKGGLCASAQMKVKFEVDQDRHHHHKTGSRHEDRSVSPKFAARMVDSSRSPSPAEFVTDNQQETMEYIIHERGDEQPKGDDDASCGLSILPTVLILSIGYLIGRP